MTYFVRTQTEGGYLYLARGKLVSNKDAAPYAHPSAAKLAAKLMNEKLAKKGLPEVEFEICNSKTGVAISDALPYVRDNPTPASKNETAVLILPGTSKVRIVLINGQYEVCRVESVFSNSQDALASAEEVAHG